jgi:glucosamine 6-phosphate synthetase-like amidotransferase/phosphosugar isomerase protein
MREKNIDVLRRGIPATELIQAQEYKELLNECVQLENSRENFLQSIIGHCRLPTKGSPENNGNNHPVVVNNIVGVHNGCIGNDDQLFREYNLPRIAQVDTEIIFSMISLYASMPTASVQDAIRRATGKLKGSLACALQDKNNPYNLYLFRAFNGTIIRHYIDAGIIVFATTEAYIDTAALRIDLGKHQNISYDAESGINFNLHLEKMTRFEIKSERTLGMFND